MKDRLKQLRTALKLKQREFAAKVGVSVGTVGQWEAGIAPPGDARISKICSVFGVREEWLRNGSGDMYAPGKSDDDQKKAIFEALYEGLRPEYKAAFKNFIRENLGANIPEDSPEKS